MSMSLNKKTRGKHPNCPTCGGRMKRLYIKEQVNKFATMKGVGWWCLECGHVMMDYSISSK